MTVRTIYATGDTVGGYPSTIPGKVPNSSMCAVAIGCGSDGRYQIAVTGIGGSGYALVDADELKIIRDAISMELARIWKE